jgi:hypothetical protein
MTFLRSAFVAAGIALAVSLPAFAEDTSPSTPSRKCAARLPRSRQASPMPSTSRSRQRSPSRTASGLGKAQLGRGESSHARAGTGLDNSANILGPEATRMVNEFTTKKCAKLKDDMLRSMGSTGN